MKVRRGFVTNSSSSSFILAFKNEEKITPWGVSWESFRECCNEYGYGDFLKLISKLKRCKENTNKEEALKYLSWYYECIKRDELRGVMSWQELDEYEETDEYKEEIRKFLESNEEYKSKKKQIEEADLIVSGMIWDSNGGLLEWAIRNGFIEDEFRRNMVMVWNVG